MKKLFESDGLTNCGQFGEQKLAFPKAADRPWALVKCVGVSLSSQSTKEPKSNQQTPPLHSTT